MSITEYSKIETLKMSPSKFFGYIRISSVTQNLDRQEEILKTKFGNSLNEIFYDIASGKNLERTNFKILLKVLREGDTLVVESFSRLSRSTKELLELLDDFSSKNIRVISIKEDFDYSTPSGKMFIGVLSIYVQYKRDLLLERQREGIALAKLKGKYKGRKPIKKPDNFYELFEKYLNSTPLNKYTAEEFRKEIGFNKSTFYRVLKKEKEARRKKNLDGH